MGLMGDSSNHADYANPLLGRILVNPLHDASLFEIPESRQ